MTPILETADDANAALAAGRRITTGLDGSLLDHVDVRICVIDGDQRCVEVNRAWLDFHGRTGADTIGARLQDLDDGAHDGALAMHGASLLQRFSGTTSTRVEGWVAHRRQGRRYLDERLVPCQRNGAPAFAIVTHDRTDLALRDEELAGRVAELHTSEALKAAIVDHALVALISTDADGAIVEFNPAAEAMFGHRRTDVVGRRVSEIVIPERFRASHEAGMARMQHGGEGRALGKRLEMHAMRADASEFPIEMVLWRTTVDGTAFYTASIVDVTERRNAAREIERQRESLRQTEKLGAMGSLLAGVAHELNNPLAIVMGRAGMLEEHCESTVTLDAADVRADARRIREAADRCGRIVRTFLDMARSRPARRTTVGLNELVRAATDMLQYSFRSHGIDLEVALCDDLPPIEADADQLGQIVMNLLVNAQQVLAGARSGRRVRIATGVDRGADPQRVCVTVGDNGPGVEPALRSLVFEPFFTTKPEGSGTGLGLAMSRSMARDHGGDLVLEPSAPGEGARFTLSLPVRGDVAAGPEAAPSPKSTRAAVGRVLVVDDEPDIADLMRDLLEHAGYEVATAASGAVGLELLATARFDVVVSDLRMPDMDGAALWREVGVRHGSLADRLLFVTGDTLSPDANRFLAQSRCAAIDKPFSKADLLSHVDRLMQRRPADAACNT